MATEKYKKKAGMKANKLAAEDFTAPSHPKVWENMGITVQYRWLTVGNLFKPPTGSNPTFTLEPFIEKSLFGRDITRLRVKIIPGAQIANWSHVVFDTCGTTRILGISLPKWVDNEATQDAYRTILRPVITALKSRRCELERIEGYFERIEKEPNEIIKHTFIFRAVYLPQSVDDGTGTGNKLDLVLLMANDPDGGSAPDGGATGPPTIDP